MPHIAGDWLCSAALIIAGTAVIAFSVIGALLLRELRAQRRLGAVALKRLRVVLTKHLRIALAEAGGDREVYKKTIERFTAQVSIQSRALEFNLALLYE